jgi:diguanylate cyclase (GGDEF)-like protein
MTVVDEPHHFSGANTRYLVGYVRRKLGEPAVAALLDGAGERRSVHELMDPFGWSSYSQFRSLLEAAGNMFDDPEALVRAGQNADLSTPQFAEAVVQLGSIESYIENYADIVSMLTPLATIRTERVDSREWLVWHHFPDGFASFREFCRFSRGHMAMGPMVFGFGRAEVVEEECRCDGAPSCRFRVRLVDDPQRELQSVRMHLSVTQGRLAELQKAVGDLVSDEDLEIVLGRVTAAAAKALSAPGAILELDVGTSAHQRRYSYGLGPHEAARIVAELGDSTDAQPSNRLVVEVRSARRYYGRLIVLWGARAFLPYQSVALATYAQFAAAVLDSATALQASRENAARAEVLLDLASALADISSSQEMAVRLVRAVPEVIGCERAIVVLIEPGAQTARMVASVGMSPAMERALGRLEIPPPLEVSGGIEYVDPDDEELDEVARSALGITGSAGGVSVPIIVDGAWVGVIVASVTHDPERLRSPELEPRLRGLAAQASSSLRNAALLDQVRHQALHDPLPGLPNRALILDRLEHLVARASRNEEAAAVLFIDLDGFKVVNDMFGHAAGDVLIRQAGERLGAAARVSDTVGRLGGDEFVVLVEGASLSAGVDAVADRLLTVLHQPYDLAPHTEAPVSVTASIGIATGPRPSAGDLLRDADIALYEAKDAGKARFVLFEPEMHAVVQHHAELKADLHDALERGEFTLVYQPVVHLETGDVTGAEALIRWQHPRRGELQPDTFIPLLEETGMIIDVGRWVLSHACIEARRWQQEGSSLTIAVNVSARQLESADFVDDVNEALTTSGLNPSLLIVEITETAIMKDTKAAVGCLTAIKGLGVRISIDDFGTGYSSLSYLRQFPVDQLKIDRSFVSAINEGIGGSTLIHALVQLGKSLDLETVAEGIERTVEHNALQEEACDSGQGFLFSRPLEPAAFREQFVVSSPGV